MSYKNVLGKDIKKGISIFTASMNRNEFLEKSIPSWLATKANEIIIVDWGSTNILAEMVEKFNDSRIIVITVPVKKYWVLSLAFNLAARFTSRNNILKVDADTILLPDFFAKHPLNNEIFYAGDWRQARNENEKHTNGIIYIKRKNFFKVHGYNEYIQTYGWDDCDLYDRLSKNNYIRYVIDLDTVNHINHNNELRTINQKTNRLDIEIEKNRLISQEIVWNGPMLPIYAIKHDNIEGKIKDKIKGNIECILSPVIPMVSYEIQEKCLNQAIKNRNYKKYNLYIEVQNGLGNRLRALASAFNIAKGSGRNLVLIWETNEHCEAKMPDLYDIGNLNELMELNNIQFKIEEKRLDNYDYYISEDTIYNYMLDSQKNTYIDDSVQKDIYIISACCLVNKHVTWQKECEFLRNLKVSMEVQAQLNIFATKIKPNKIEDCIGVHIRMHQWGKSYENISNYTEEAKKSIEKWRSASNWQVFLQEIKKILSVNPGQKFFLCCDNETAYSELTKILPNTFIQTDKIVFDRSKIQVQNAVVDLVLLSRTKEILGSNWSTFTEIAYRLSGKKLRMAGKDF